jgi:beta-galactosidase
MADAQVTDRLLARVNGLAYGGDYNPEQWPERVWTDDLRLMREAGVTLVTVAVFGWAWLEPEPGRYDFARLDRILEGLHGAGVAVDLATATASPPPWFSHAHPQTLPVDRDGRVLTYGSRQAFCPSSPVYREAALALANQLAQRYHDHPALAAWHVHNEYACHNAHCYCEVSAAAFRDWLRDRYGDLDGLNEAWGTSFWSQIYTDWAQVQPPRATVTSSNPSQLLDFRRFSSAEHLANFVAERDLLHERSPGIPITTNLMPFHTELDHWAWGKEMTGRDRFVSSDHYLVANEPHEPGAQIAYAADLSRSLADGGSWLLMEHSTSAGELAAAQPRQAAGTADPRQPRPRGPRQRGCHVLPVAGQQGRLGEVALRDGAARGHRLEGLARGGPAGRAPQGARRDRWLHRGVAGCRAAGLLERMGPGVAQPTQR